MLACKPISLAVGAILLMAMTLAAPARAQITDRAKFYGEEYPGAYSIQVIDFAPVGDPPGDALIGGFSTTTPPEGPCLIYAYDAGLTLNYDVRLAIQDIDGNVLGLPIERVDTGFHGGIDSQCFSSPVVRDQIQFDGDPDTGTVTGNIKTEGLISAGGSDPADLSVVLTPAGDPRMNLTASSGQFTFTPDDPTVAGEAVFSYQLTAPGNIESNVGTLTVTWPAVVPEPPVVEDQLSFGGDAATAIATGNIKTEGLISPGSSDPNDLRVLLVPGDDPRMQLDTASGDFTFTPQDTSVGGEASFTYRIGIPDGIVSNTGNITISWDGVIGPPVVRASIAFAGNPSTGVVSGNLIVSGLESYAGALENLSVAPIDDSQLPSNGQLSVNTDTGAFSFTPNNPSVAGAASFPYNLLSPQGPSNQGQVQMSWPGAALPSPPPEVEMEVAFPSDASTVSGNLIEAALISYGGNPDDLRVIADSEVVPDLGDLTVDSVTGIFTFTPDDTSTGGEATFTYVLNSPGGPSERSTASLSWQAEGEPGGPETPPTLNPSVRVQGAPGARIITGNVITLGVASYDGDSSLLTATQQGELQNGFGNLDLRPNGDFTFTATNLTGSQDAFNYILTTPGGNPSAPGTILLSWDPIGEVRAVDDEYDTGEQPDGVEVKANDEYSGDLDELTVVIVEEPANGSISDRSDFEGGTIIYVPGSSSTEETSDSFSYRLVRYSPPHSGENEQLRSNVATVDVTVSPDGPGGDLADKETEDGATVEELVSENERPVMERIDVLCPELEPETEGQEQFKEKCTRLRKQGTTAEQVLDALTAITPEELAAQSKMGRELSFLQHSNVGARIAGVRGGTRGLSLTGLNLSYEDTTVAGSTLDAMLEEAMSALGGAASADEVNDFGNLGVFVRGELGFGEHDETELEAAFDFDAYSITVGADYRFNPNFFAGLSLSYGDSEVEFENDGGELTAENISIALYGSWYSSGAAYLDGIFSYGWTEIDSTRNIRYTDFDGKVDESARGDSDGTQYYFSLNAGYNFNFGGFNFDPYGRFYYLRADIDAYREQGGGGWELAFDDQDFKSMTASAGGQVSYAFTPSWGVISPYARVEYTREFEDNANGIVFRFVNDPGADRGSFMQIQPDDPESSYLVYTVGVSAQLKYGFAAYATYEILGSYDNLDAEKVSFGMRWETTF